MRSKDEIKMSSQDLLVRCIHHDFAINWRKRPQFGHPVKSGRASVSGQVRRRRKRSPQGCRSWQPLSRVYYSQSVAETRQGGVAPNQADVCPKHALQIFWQERDARRHRCAQPCLLEPCSKAQNQIGVSEGSDVAVGPGVIITDIGRAKEYLWDREPLVVHR